MMRLYCDNKHTINKIMEKLHWIVGKRYSLIISKWIRKKMIKYKLINVHKYTASSESTFFLAESWLKTIHALPAKDKMLDRWKWNCFFSFLFNTLCENKCYLHFKFNLNLMLSCAGYWAHCVEELKTKYLFHRRIDSIFLLSKRNIFFNDSFIEAQNKSGEDFQAEWGIITGMVHP